MIDLRSETYKRIKLANQIASVMVQNNYVDVTVTDRHGKVIGTHILPFGNHSPLYSSPIPNTHIHAWEYTGSKAFYYVQFNGVSFVVDATGYDMITNGYTSFLKR